MPIRFPTEAANADILGDDMPNTTAAGGQPKARAPRDRYERSRETYRPAGDVRPGKDINAPGFIKDKDSNKP
jgi:hypothetical protein